MFQLPIRRVMQFVVMIVALVSISSVCRADQLTLNDTKYNYTLETEYRLVVEVWDDVAQELVIIYHYTTPQDTVYAYTGSDSNEYYTIYIWHSDFSTTYVNMTVSQVWVESQVNGFGDWYYQGTPNYTTAP